MVSHPRETQHRHLCHFVPQQVCVAPVQDQNTPVGTESGLLSGTQVPHTCSATPPNAGLFGQRRDRQTLG